MQVPDLNVNPVPKDRKSEKSTISMNLAEALIKRVPRETSGPKTTNRPAYQHAWGLLLLIELYESQKAFSIVFDYHDDTLVLDSESDPSTIDIYQVKTRDDGKMWSISYLTKKNGKKPSFLSNLVSTYMNFKEHATSVNFISNQRFDCKLQSFFDDKDPNSSARESICIDELDKKEIDKICRCITKQLGIDPQQVNLSAYHLRYSSLALHDQERHLIGVIYDFLHRNFEEKSGQAKRLYQNLILLVQKRTGHEFSPSSFTELIEHKCITKTEFEGMLKRLPSPSKDKELLDHAYSQLCAEVSDFGEREDLQNGCQRYLIHKKDKSTAHFEKLRDATIKVLLDAEAEKIKFSSLLNKIEHVLSRISLLCPDLLMEHDDYFLKGMVVIENEQRKLL